MGACTAPAARCPLWGDSLLELVKKGLLEQDEVYANAVNKLELRAMLERAGVKLQAA